MSNLLCGEFFFPFFLLFHLNLLIGQIFVLLVYTQKAKGRCVIIESSYVKDIFRKDL